MPLTAAILPEFDHEMANTRRCLERVPDGKLDWTPHSKSMTMGRLATHLATLSQWTNAVMNQDFFDVSTSPAPTVLKSSKEILESFDQCTAAARKAIAAASDEQLMKSWSLKKEGQTLFTLPRLGVVRSFVLNHTIHHRAQLGVYLRLNDIAVPSIYGPSADEAMS